MEGRFWPKDAPGRGTPSYTAKRTTGFENGRCPRRGLLSAWKSHQASAIQPVGSKQTLPKMLQLTKRTEYGLIALVHLAGRRGGRTSAREISERYQVPRRLLAEVLKHLARAGLVESQRGAQGGFELVRDPSTITVGEVVTELEGAPTLASCDVADLFSRGDCDVLHHCPIRSPLQRIREGIWRQMEHTTLEQLADPNFQLAPAGETTASEDAETTLPTGR